MNWKCSLSRSARYQFFAAISGAILGIPDGIQLVWSSPLASKLLSEDSPIKTTLKDIELFETLFMAGLFLGIPINMYLVNTIGPKRSVLWSAKVSLCLWILVGLFTKIEYILVIRFFYGISTNLAYTAVPTYISEIADKNIRGFLLFLMLILETVGYLITYAIVPYVSIYVIPLIGVSIIILNLLIFPFMPDSPYYLVRKNKTLEAKRALSKLRQNDAIDIEFTEIQLSVERQMRESEHIGYVAMFLSNLKLFLKISVLIFGLNASGYSVLLMNIHQVLESVHSVNLGPEITPIVMIIVFLISTSLVSPLTDIAGRKALIILSSILTGFCDIFLAIYFTCSGSIGDSQISGYYWFPSVILVCFGAVFKFGLGTVPFILPGELYGVKAKTLGLAISDGVFGVSAMVTISIYHELNKFGRDYAFYFFGICCFGTALFSKFYLPETKGLSLEEIQIILKESNAVENSSDINEQAKENNVAN